MAVRWRAQGCGRLCLSMSCISADPGLITASRKLSRPTFCCTTDTAAHIAPPTHQATRQHTLQLLKAAMQAGTPAMLYASCFMPPPSGLLVLSPAGGRREVSVVFNASGAAAYAEVLGIHVSERDLADQPEGKAGQADGVLHKFTTVLKRGHMHVVSCKVRPRQRAGRGGR